MVTSFWNLCDLLAFAPPLLELALNRFLPGSLSLVRVDLRWFKMLRCVMSLSWLLVVSSALALVCLACSAALLFFSPPELPLRCFLPGSKFR